MNNRSMTSFAFKSLLLGCFVASLTLTSCGSSEASSKITGTAAGESTASAAPADVHYKITDLVDMDLSAHGIPVIAKVPKNAKVMKYATNGDVCVYGGKFFKLTFSQMDGAMDQNLSDMKTIVGDKEMNPGFNKFEAVETNSFMKSNTEGQLAFICGLQSADKTILIVEGMPYDLSPDQFSDYSADDVKLMYEAAKLAVEKK